MYEPKIRSTNEYGFGNWAVFACMGFCRDVLNVTIYISKKYFLFTVILKLTVENIRYLKTKKNINISEHLKLGKCNECV